MSTVDAKPGRLSWIRRQNKKRYVIALAIVLVVSSASAAGYLAFRWSQSQQHQEAANGEYMTMFQYNIGIRMDQRTTYVLVPVIQEWNQSTSELMKNMTVVSGNATFAIENCVYGAALNITAKGEVYLSASVKRNLDFEARFNSSLYPYGLADFNMVTNRTPDKELESVLVYCHKPSDAPISISLEYVVGSTIQRTDGYFSVENGWQEVQIFAQRPPQPH